MEKVKKVKEWLTVNYGYGDGSGSGDGYGSGSGSGDGSGDGSGIKSFNGRPVYHIDNVETLIDHIHGNIAKGSILNNDLTLTPCYAVKSGNYFAHGETLEKANSALQAKILSEMPVEEKIVEFCEHFKHGEKYSGHDFFEWHHILTGSCEMGRKSFVANKGLDLDKLYTVKKFIEVCKDDYGSDIIKQLAEVWNDNVDR